MNFRELLRYELWSKEKSRKVLRPVARFLKHAAIVSAVLAALLWGLVEVGSLWLTNGERKAGTAALVQLEELARLQLNASDGFNEGDVKAKALVNIARKDAWTIRDYEVVERLSALLWMLELNRDSDLEDARFKEIAQQRHVSVHTGCGDNVAGSVRDTRMNTYALWRAAAKQSLD
jgi:hypothetical protein